jgi:hypothetical protein
VSAAFIDVDEFFVLMDETADLPILLEGFEDFGGVATSWRMFGSSEACPAC